MKKNVLLLMNYWPNEETYWLCQQLRSNNVSFRLVGIAERLRKLRYAKFCGNLIWNMVRFVRALKVVLGIKPNELVLVLDDTASSTYTGLFMAQGGLSVAGGCRCLTKELDMIAC